MDNEFENALNQALKELYGTVGVPDRGAITGSRESLKRAYKNIKINHEELKRLVKQKYYDREGKRLTSNTTLEKLIDCMDDTVVSEWLNEIADWQANIQDRYDRTIRMSQETVSALEKVKAETDKAIGKLAEQAEKATNAIKQEQEALEKEKLLIKDERVRDAFYVYKELVNMPISTDGIANGFDSKDFLVKAKLQNIKNASYFIWALYSNEKTAPMIEISNVSNDD